MKYCRDQLAFSHSSTDTATRQATSCAHAGTDGGCTGPLCHGFTLFSSLKLILPLTPAQSQDNFMGTQNNCSTSPSWPCRPDPAVFSSLFSPCSTPQEAPLTEGCFCPVFGLLGGCRQLQDSHVQGFPHASFTNWALRWQSVMTLACQVFSYMGRERGARKMS